jgi:hypothetical protein
MIECISFRAFFWKRLRSESMGKLTNKWGTKCRTSWGWYQQVFYIGETIVILLSCAFFCLLFAESRRIQPLRVEQTSATPRSLIMQPPLPRSASEVHGPIYEHSN